MYPYGSRKLSVTHTSVTHQVKGKNWSQSSCPNSSANHRPEYVLNYNIPMVSVLAMTNVGNLMEWIKKKSLEDSSMGLICRS